RRQLQLQRPLSAPISREGSDQPPSEFGRATSSNCKRHPQQQRRQRPASSGRRRHDGSGTTGCVERDRSWGHGGSRGALDDNFGCLKARLAKTVESSSNFVGDIRRLRKAGGAATAAGAASSSAGRSPFGPHAGGQKTVVDGGRGSPTATSLAPEQAGAAARIEPLALAKELGVQAIVNRITHAIMHEKTANVGDCGEHGNARGREGGGGRGQPERRQVGHLSNTLLDERNLGWSGATSSTSSPARQRRPPHRQQLASPPQPRTAGATASPSSPPRPLSSSPHTSPDKKQRPKKDVERLRRVVRDTMSSTPKSSSSSSLPPRGGGASPGRERGGTHPPQWSQKHEACLAGLRRMLRATGSPLIRAKDPAILVGALLRRQVGEGG
ncbi:unnamed protein product, partial [Hapterophycus canaliculatus]